MLQEYLTHPHQGFYSQTTISLSLKKSISSIFIVSSVVKRPHNKSPSRLVDAPVGEMADPFYDDDENKSNFDMDRMLVTNQIRVRD